MRITNRTQTHPAQGRGMNPLCGTCTCTCEAAILCALIFGVVLAVLLK